MRASLVEGLESAIARALWAPRLRDTVAHLGGPRQRTLDDLGPEKMGVGAGEFVRHSRPRSSGRGLGDRWRARPAPVLAGPSAPFDDQFLPRDVRHRKPTIPHSRRAMMLAAQAVGVLFPEKPVALEPPSEDLVDPTRLEPGSPKELDPRKPLVTLAH